MTFCTAGAQFRALIAAPWYKIVMLRLRRPAAEELTRYLAEAKTADLSYPEAGGTMDLPLPAGYRIDRYERRLNSEGSVFERAVGALGAWRAHVAAGVEVVPPDARVAVGASVLLVTRAVGLWAAAPCRVVYVVDKPDQFSFAYGTLPGHPEQGEAALTVERDEIGVVVCRIVSFSRTVAPLARIGSPITRRVQRRVTHRYVEALAAASESAS